MHPPKCDKDPDIFLKEVDTSMDTGLLRHTLEKDRIQRRFVDKTTGKTTQTIKVRCNQGSWKDLLNFNRQIKNKVCVIERDHTVL